MKLKYYLRGLGIGMIVTALILGISFSNRQEQAAQTMTDDQIRERAAELGMVDSSELTLAALQNSVKQSAESKTEDIKETQEQKETTAESETNVETSETQTTTEPETTAEPENTIGPETTPEPEVTTKSEAVTEPEVTAVPETTIIPEAATVPEQVQTAGITIIRGDDSGSVSRQLYEAGLVENAKEFDNYLCNNGYSRSINPGTYEIAPGTSEEEIAKIITGKH